MVQKNHGIKGHPALATGDFMTCRLCGDCKMYTFFSLFHDLLSSSLLHNEMLQFIQWIF